MFGLLQNIFGVNSNTQSPHSSSGSTFQQNSIFNENNTVGNALSDITVDSNLSYPNMFPNIGINSAPVSNSNLLVGDSLSSIASAISARASLQPVAAPAASQIAPSTPSTGVSPSQAQPTNAGNNAANGTVSFSGEKVTLSAEVVKKVKSIAQKINCDYKDLVGVIYAESRWKTNKWNGRTAVGLTQFTQICIDDLNQIYHLNLTKDKIAKMNIMQQLDLAEKSLIRAKKIAGYPTSHRLTASELYAINFFPQNAKRSYCILRSGERGFAGNKGLDLNRDGKITPNELATVVNQGRKQVVC